MARASLRCVRVSSVGVLIRCWQVNAAGVQGVEGLLHVGRQRSLERHLFTTVRMPKRQTVRVKCLSLDEYVRPRWVGAVDQVVRVDFGSPSVQAIGEHRVTKP